MGRTTPAADRLAMAVDILAMTLASFPTAAFESRDMADEALRVSELLDAYRRGDDSALEKLVPLVYEDSACSRAGNAAAFRPAKP